jgi:hypothetical protein
VPPFAINDVTNAVLSEAHAQTWSNTLLPKTPLMAQFFAAKSGASGDLICHPDEIQLPKNALSFFCSTNATQK